MLIPRWEVETTLKNEESHVHLIWNLYLLHQLSPLIPSFPKGLFISLLLLPSPITGDKLHTQIGIKDQRVHSAVSPDRTSWQTSLVYCDYFLFPHTVGGIIAVPGFPVCFSILLGLFITVWNRAWCLWKCLSVNKQRIKATMRYTDQTLHASQNLCQNSHTCASSLAPATLGQEILFWFEVLCPHALWRSGACFLKLFV